MNKKEIKELSTKELKVLLKIKKEEEKIIELLEDELEERGDKRIIFGRNIFSFHRDRSHIWNAPSNRL